MIIKQLMRYHGDVELRWLNGHYYHSTRGRLLRAQFLDRETEQTVFDELSCDMSPFRVTRRVVSRGEVQFAHENGNQCVWVIPNLHDFEGTDLSGCLSRNHHDLHDNKGKDQGMLHCQAGTGVPCHCAPTLEGAALSTAEERTS